MKNHRLLSPVSGDFYYKAGPAQPHWSGVQRAAALWSLSAESEISRQDNGARVTKGLRPLNPAKNTVFLDFRYFFYLLLDYFHSAHVWSEFFRNSYCSIFIKIVFKKRY